MKQKKQKKKKGRDSGSEIGKNIAPELGDLQSWWGRKMGATVSCPADPSPAGLSTTADMEMSVPMKEITTHVANKLRNESPQ